MGEVHLAKPKLSPATFKRYEAVCGSTLEKYRFYRDPNGPPYAVFGRASIRYHSPNLTVNVSLAESKEWATLRTILQEVCDEITAAREPLLRRMRHHVLSVTKEDTIL